MTTSDSAQLATERADSLTPQEVGQDSSSPAATLSDEDLAVLPGHGRSVSRGWLVPLVLLLAAVPVYRVATGSRTDDPAGAEAQAVVATPAPVAPADVVLLPPPPAVAEEEFAQEEPTADEPAEVTPAKSPAALVAAGSHDKPGPAARPSSRPKPQATPKKTAPLARPAFGRRQGEAVARFADLPQKTLVRLTSNEQPRESSVATKD